jgi:ATP-dependent RNA helicase RhlE
LGQQLENAGYRAASLQGNLSQNRRQAALDGFRAGSYQILVATDIAARGIDVSGISHVINYDMPDTVDAYTHRIGRTGRAAKTGDAFTFTTREDGEMVRSIERVLGSRVERRTLDGFDYRKPMPGRDTEFARLPRQPQPRRTQKIAKPSGYRPATSAPKKNYGSGRQEKRTFGAGKTRKPHARPAQG